MKKSSRSKSFVAVSSTPSPSKPSQVDDLAAHPGLDVELLMSTHMTVVVRARVEFDDAEEPCDTGLVISRSRCSGGRPSGHVLLDAARQCAVRLASRAGSMPKAVKRVWVRVNGRWQALLEGVPLRPGFLPA